MAKDMKNYAWFLGSIALPAAFVIVSWPIVWYKMKFTDHITPEMRKTPMKYYLILGGFDAFQNILSAIPAPFIPGPLQVVVSQLAIPINMGMSFLFLSTRYGWNHGLGVLLILGGVVVATLPNFLNGNSTLGDKWYMLIILVISNLPSSASNVYKERALKDVDLDVWYFNAWIATFQIFIGILTVPLVFSELLSGGEPIAPAELGTYLQHASKCFFGTGSLPGDEACNETPIVFVIFLVFNIAYNILMLMVFKLGSATLAVVASALRVALSDVGFQWKFLSGPAYKDLTWYDGVALVILIGGLFAYRLRPERSSKAPAVTTTTEGAVATPHLPRSIPSFSGYAAATGNEFPHTYLLEGDEPRIPKRRTRSQIRGRLYQQIGIQTNNNPRMSITPQPMNDPLDFDEE
eukprot:Colp12_sorted_trinity150504_noHs@32929